MIKNLALTVLIIFSTAQALAMSNKDICNLRANLIEDIAKERDKGKSKNQINKAMRNNLNYQLPSAFDKYLNAVYDGKKYTPNELKTISLYSCYQEFGLIK